MSPFSLSSLILTLTTLMFSIIAYQSDRNSKVNRSWFYFSIPFAVWSFAHFSLTNTSDPVLALRWQYILDVAAIWIPSTYFAFTASLLRYKKTYTLIALYCCSFILTLLSLTPYFKLGVERQFDFFWIKPGPLYLIFPIFFGLVVILSAGHIINTLRRIDRTSSYSSQLKNTLIVCIIGFLAGGTNFFPQLFNIYPFGNYIVIGYIVVMVYGVIRYKVLSPKVVSAQLFASALLLVTMVEVVLASGYKQMLYKVFILAATAIFSWLFIKSVKVEIETKDRLEVIDHELVKKNDELKRVSDEKTEFVSLASHQIRGPLTSIKGYSSLLLEGDMGELSKEAKEALQVMIRSCDTLSSVVNDYLDVSRIEQGKMRYEFVEVDARELILECVKELTPSIQAHCLTCEVDMPTDVASSENWFDVRADRSKLKQVLMNLIDNALKYTPKGKISVKLFQKEAHKVRIEVKDTGLGIAADVLPKLFSKYTRAPDAHESNILGTGLGLYIARAIIEAHEGKVWAESSGIGKGSTFIIEMKAA